MLALAGSLKAFWYWDWSISAFSLESLVNLLDELRKRGMVDFVFWNRLAYEKKYFGLLLMVSTAFSAIHVFQYFGLNIVDKEINWGGGSSKIFLISHLVIMVSIWRCFKPPATVATGIRFEEKIWTSVWVILGTKILFYNFTCELKELFA